MIPSYLATLRYSAIAFFFSLRQVFGSDSITHYGTSLRNLMNKSERGESGTHPPILLNDSVSNDSSRPHVALVM